MESGTIIRFNTDNSRNWIVLNVTKKDIRRGLNVEREGFHAFGGLWHGRNPNKVKSYGKVKPIIGDYTIVRQNIHRLSVNEIQKLVD